MDVIASTSFGIEIDSHSDPNNQFVQNCNQLFKFSFASLRLILFSTYCLFLCVYLSATLLVISDGA